MEEQGRNEQQEHDEDYCRPERRHQHNNDGHLSYRDVDKLGNANDSNTPVAGGGGGSSGSGSGGGGAGGVGVGSGGSGSGGGGGGGLSVGVGVGVGVGVDVGGGGDGGGGGGGGACGDTVFLSAEASRASPTATFLKGGPLSPV